MSTFSHRTRLIEKIKQWTYQPTCSVHRFCTHNNSPFVNVHKLREWMCDQSEGETSTNFELVIEESHQLLEQSGASLHFCESKSLSDCLMLLAALVVEDYDDLIPFFRRAGITDANLAKEDFKEDLIRETLRKGYVQGRRIDDVIEYFQTERWKFCPPSLEMDMQTQNIFHTKIAMPFCHVERISTGGTASVFQALVPKEFVSRKMMEHLGDSFYHEDHGHCYELAIKSYSEYEEEAFESEVNALRGLRDQEGIVKYFGCYQHAHGEPGGALTRHIMLELGRMDLVGYFESHYPPELPGEIIRFYERLFKISESIKSIHHLRYGRDIYLGWHGGIKPENLLLVKNTWKLAGFKYAVFEREGKRTDKFKVSPKERTHAYTSPEVVETDGQPIDVRALQDADIWSFGCVLSIAATWVVLRSKGVEEYEMLRMLASENEGKNEFHNGKVVRPEIKEWHIHLKALARRSDVVSEALLDLVESEMLVAKDSARRISSEDLPRKLKLIIQTAKERVLGNSTALKETECTQQCNVRMKEAVSKIGSARQEIRNKNKRRMSHPTSIPDSVSN